MNTPIRRTIARSLLVPVVAMVAASCAATSTASSDDVLVPGIPVDDRSAVPTTTVSITPVSTGFADPDSAPVPTTSTVPPVATVPSTTIVTTGTSVPPKTSGTTATTTTSEVTGGSAFDQSLQTILDNGSVAVSATLLRDGVVQHEAALGSRTGVGDEPVEVGDRYRIASISKVVTAITVLQLVEAGEIDLDEAVGRRLSERVGVDSPAAMIESITVRDLLTHRSGITQYENLMFRNQVGSCPEAAAVALSRSLERSPATTYRYSNLNFCLLGLAIEEFTGRAYVDVVDEELLAPLDIDGMRLAPTFDAGDDRPVVHRSDAGRNYMETLESAGAWIASPTEVATIIDSLDPVTPGWKPLEPATLTMMQAITADPPGLEPPPPPTRGYGMGLMIFGPGRFGHTGTLESTHAMTVRRADGITWAITVSGDYPSSTRDLAAIVDDALRAGGFI